MMALRAALRRRIGVSAATPAQSVTFGAVLILGCIATLGLVVNLGSWASEVVGWGLCAAILLYLTAYAFERRVP